MNAGRRLDVGLGTAITLFYLGSRFALVWRFPPHVDESVFADLTLRGFEVPDARFEPLASGQRPLLEWLGMGVMRLGVEPLTALRLISLASGAGTLALVWYLGWRLGGRPVAWTAAALFAIVPFFLVYSVIGLYDPLATFLVAAAFVLAVLVAERRSLGIALLLGAALGAGLLTKLTTEVAYVALPTSALFLDWRAERRLRRVLEWLGLLAVGLVVSWAMYQVLKLNDLYNQLGRAQSLTLARHSLTTFLKHPWHWVDTNGSSYGSALLGYLTVPVLLALAVGVVAAVRVGWRVAAMLLVWAVVPIAATVALADVPYVRWLAVGIPPVLVLAARGAVTVGEWLPTRLGRGPQLLAGVAVLAAVLVAPALVWDARTLASPVTRPYPGHDDLDYVREYSAGGPWLRLVPELRRLAGGRGLRVAFAGPGMDYLEVALRHDGNIRLVDSAAGSADAALYGFENAGSLPVAEGLSWKLQRVYPRPRGGVPVLLFQHGAVRQGRFEPTPDDLRRDIGGTDKDYDRYVSAHASVKSWLVSWYQAHPAP